MHRFGIVALFATGALGVSGCGVAAPTVPPSVAVPTTAPISSAASSPDSSNGGGTGSCLTIDAVKARGGWNIIAPTADWPPYWFLDAQGKDAGMDVDLFSAVNAKLGVTEKSEHLIPYDGVLPALASKQSDFNPSATTVTAARVKQWGFSMIYGDGSIVVMTRPDTGIQSENDLAGKKIGVQTAAAGDAAAQALEATLKAQGKDFASLKSYPNPSDAFLDLGNKRLDAVINSSAPVQDWINHHSGQFSIAGPVGTALYAAWQFRLEDMAPGCIGASINTVLEQFRQDGTLSTLQTKWFGKALNLPYDNPLGQ